jgi:hypothetical protein
VSDLQNQFPNDAIEIAETYNAGSLAKVIDLIENPSQAVESMGHRERVELLAWPEVAQDLNAFGNAAADAITAGNRTAAPRRRRGFRGEPSSHRRCARRLQGEA